ncbi:MAG: flagellar assembly protein FlgT [Gammaproteobacteria bacterium]|nr:flagellar assembly protein FlgT [Gammaproteobacteria bacterium]
MKTYFMGCAGLLLVCMLVGAAQAQAVEAEGTSPINGPVGVAKRLALQDAIRQALLQANAQVSTTTVVSSRGVVSDNVRFTARGNVTNVVILDEWTDEANYYVRIRAQVPGAIAVTNRAAGTNTEAGNVSLQVSAAPPGLSAQYRRKIAITQFHVLDRTQIADLPNIEIALARELKRRLDVDGRVRTADASQYLLPLGNDDGVISQGRILGALPAAQEVGQLATEFAESLGVQFVVSGVIRDMGVTKHLLGARVRHLELDVIVHDGITGTEVARHRLNESVVDAGLFDFPTTLPVLNDKFYASPFGQRIHRVLDKLVSMLINDLNSQLFTARVIRAEGRQVFFDAGGAANIKVGDVLNTFQLSQSAVNDLPGQRALGFSESPASILVVTQVQRLFSVGELDSDTTRLSPGDVIRFEP